MRALTASPEQVAAATPADRDRYLDLLRGLAIGVVVLGHWLLAVVWMADGRLQATAVLDAAPGTRWVTWLLQVMPLFFLVGGVVNARSWRATRAVGGGYVGWIARRAARLLRPTVVLVWTWVALAAVAAATGVEPGLVVLGARSALIPLWFLAVYLLMSAGVPALLQAYDRLGPALVAALLVTATAVDVAVRRPATAWLDRPGPWTAVVRINTVAMTVYLWHLTVLVLVVGALSLTGSWWSVAPLSLTWWLTRPLWLAGMAVLLAPVVVALLPVEHSVPAPRRHGTGPLAVAGMLVATATAAGATAAVTLGGVLGVPGVACAVALTAAARHAGAFGRTGTEVR